MKPSYEELEEQLNRSRRLCDAALANERVWETAMMQACGEDGPKSVADKFAELKAQLAALAAENAGLRDEISNITFMRDDDFFGSTQRAQEVMGRLVNVKTPSTDAFLAEVRAQGVEMFARETERLEWHESTVRFVLKFAAQLRQGGAA